MCIDDEYLVERGWVDESDVYDDCSPIPHLVREDTNRCIRLSNMTDVQADTFRLYVLHGLSLREIAALRGITPAAVRKTLIAAWNKASRVPDCGVITVLVETFGRRDCDPTWYEAVQPIRRYISETDDA